MESLVSEIVINLDVPHASKETVATASFCLAGAFRVHFARIMRDRSGQYHLNWPGRVVCRPCQSHLCGMPVGLNHRYCHHCGQYQARRRLQPGESKYLDYIHPVDNASRLAVERVVFDAYLKAVAEATEEAVA